MNPPPWTRRTRYQELPKEHFLRVQQLRDCLAACLILDPALVDGCNVARLELEQCSCHVLADVLGVCRIYRSNPTEALVRSIEWNEVVRLMALADAGKVWRWYSEYYAYALLHLEQIERAYSQAVNFEV